MAFAHDICLLRVEIGARRHPRSSCGSFHAAPLEAGLIVIHHHRDGHVRIAHLRNHQRLSRLCISLVFSVIVYSWYRMEAFPCLRCLLFSVALSILTRFLSLSLSLSFSKATHVEESCVLILHCRFSSKEKVNFLGLLQVSSV